MEILSYWKNNKLDDPSRVSIADHPDFCPSCCMYGYYSLHIIHINKIVGQQIHHYPNKIMFKFSLPFTQEI